MPRVGGGIGRRPILGAVIAVGSIVVCSVVSRHIQAESCGSSFRDHPMRTEKSSHWGAIGADPGCKDCHVLRDCPTSISVGSTGEGAISNP